MTGHDVQLERLRLNAEWIPVSAGLGRLCNSWAERRDLVVYLGADGGQGKASAFYMPDTAQIEINSTDAFGTVSASDIGDLTDRMELSKFPVAGGLALHEALHARYSTSDLAKVRAQFSSTSAYDVFTHLEETRIEGRGVLLFSQDAGYLRVVCKTLLMKDGPETWSHRAAAILLLGRSEVGVLDAADVAPVESYLLQQDGWTNAVVRRLREIVTSFKFLDDNGADLDKQIALSVELDALLPKDPPGSGDGSEGEEGLDGLEGLMSAIEAALGAAERGGLAQIFEGAEEAAAEAAREAAIESSKMTEKNKSEADNTFRNAKGDPAPVPQALQGARMPTGAERGAAIRLAQDLELARYRDREIQEFESEIPPGRLNGGEAMRLAAARWAGGDSSRYRPFTRQERLETDEPKLTVGIMCDVSGSMGKMQPKIGVATYVISEAIYRISDATAAQVYFGTSVSPGLRKGERLREVRTWSGGGAYEEFDKGFRALDGELDLLHGSGARLLFVASDGEFKNGPGRNQNEAANTWVKACATNGVAVVWLQLRGQNALEKFPGVEVVTVDGDILDATRAIGQACIRSLATVSGL